MCYIWQVGPQYAHTGGLSSGNEWLFAGKEGEGQIFPDVMSERRVAGWLQIWARSTLEGRRDGLTVDWAICLARNGVVISEQCFLPKERLNPSLNFNCWNPSPLQPHKLSLSPNILSKPIVNPLAEQFVHAACFFCDVLAEIRHQLHRPPEVSWALGERKSLTWGQHFSHENPHLNPISHFSGPNSIQFKL